MKTHFSKLLPAIVMMLIIFSFSAQPGSEMLNFDWADRLVKKGGHMIGYGLLALSYLRAFDFQREKRLIAWLLAVLYAVTDEFHQSFVPGRNPSIVDVLVFDNFGAVVSLWLMNYSKKEVRTSSIRPVVEEPNR